MFFNLLIPNKASIFFSIHAMHFFHSPIWSDCISQLFHSINAHNDFFSLHASMNSPSGDVPCEIHAYLAADNLEGERGFD